MRKIGVLLVLFLLIPLVGAENLITFEATKVQDKVVLGGEGVFNGYVSNKDSSPHVYRFVLEDEDWEMEIKPRLVYVGVDSGENFDIRLRPLVDKPSGNYGVAVTAIANDDESIRVKKYINVKFLDYEDFLGVNVNFPDNYDPETTNYAKVTLKNTEEVSLKDLSIMVDSKYFSGIVNEIAVGRKDSETVNLELNFDEAYKEGVYNVDVEVLVGDDVVLSKELQSEINYYPLGSEIQSPQSAFLLKRTKVTKANEGDIIAEEVYQKRVSIFEDLFTEFSREPDRSNQVTGGYVYEWDFQLGPGESESVEITTDYRFLTVSLILLAIVVALVVGYFRREITLSKKVLRLTKGKEGYSTLSVLMQIKNKSRREVRNVKIMDTITNLVGEHKIRYNTIEPKVVKKGMGGVNLIWELERMEAGRELNISYDVKTETSKVGGMFNLPVRARFINRKGKWKTVTSEGKLV